MGRPEPMVIEPAVLAGRLVRLEPLGQRHVEGLVTAGLHPELFRWYLDPVESRDDLLRWIDAAFRGRESGSEEPFVTLDAGSGEVIGSTRYLNIDRANHRLEIGSTWLTPSRQGTGANTEAKLLGLRHAFTTLGCIRVEFKTDARNERSRAALLAIGATFEGVFRHHMIRADGTHRHSAYYSIVGDEWPAVERHLEARLARQAPTDGARAEPAT